MKTVYLSGPINGCSDPECRDWRNQAVECLIKIGFEVIDPMARDYRGDEDKNVESIVKGDLQDIEQADILLVNAECPSWGTAMEVFYDFHTKKVVVSIVPFGTRVSPWLSYHSRAVVCSLEEAIGILRARYLFEL